MLYCVGTKGGVCHLDAPDCTGGFSVRQSVQYLIQPCRRNVQLSGDVSFETDRKLGVLPVSVAGGMSHNIGQIAVAAFVVENINIFTICRCFSWQASLRTADRCGSPGDHTKDWRTAETIRRKYVCTHI